jgi:alcohol dehydrogenase class IV
MDTDYFFDLVVPQRIVFGWGRRREVGRWARTLGRRAWLVCGVRWDPTGGLMAEIAGSLREEGVESVPVATLSHEPEVADVDRLADELRGHDPGEGDFLLAIGGGAAIDLAKAAAAMATNREGATVKDYLEGVGRGLTIVHPPLPVMAMPTTAGAGAEATRNAVISSYDPPFKKSLRDDRLMPRIALVDPELTVTAAADVTAASGMDAITQLIESYVSRPRQSITRILTRSALPTALPAIVEAVENGRSRNAREAMSLAALLSGMALANSGLGMAHGVAAALGIHCRVPHGAACALMLPVAIRANMIVAQGDIAELSFIVSRAAGERPAESANRSPAERADAFLEQIETLCDRVGTPRRLSQVGVTRDQIPQIVRSSRGSSMSGNPRELTDAELTEILESIL